MLPLVSTTACALLAAAALPPPASAPTPAAVPTTVPPMFYSEIVRAADCIVTATVVDRSSHYENGRKTIYTSVRLGTLTFLKGEPRTELTLRFEGGAIGDDRLEIAGMPQLEAGKRYMLYIDGTAKPGKISPIVGFHQGAFEIVERNGREVLLNTNGEELIGVQNDRFVFRKKPVTAAKPGHIDPAPTPAAPASAVENHEVKWAHPNADALEARMLTQRLREAQRARIEARLTELPAPGPAVPAVDASPAPQPAATATRVEARDRALATPLVLEKNADPGTRFSVQDLIRNADLGR